MRKKNFLNLKMADCKSLIIHNLDKRVTKESLSDIFALISPISSVKITDDNRNVSYNEVGVFLPRQKHGYRLQGSIKILVDHKIRLYKNLITMSLVHIIMHANYIIFFRTI